VIGELIAITSDGTVPLVMIPGRTTAVAARATIAVQGAHIGRRVVLGFENGDDSQPILLGVLQEGGWPGEPDPSHVQIESDGERCLVTAEQQLVLRCGKASITLTKAGKVLIEGTYVSTRSSGVNRIKGGSIQLN
jgi:hypothetical protein